MRKQLDSHLNQMEQNLHYRADIDGLRGIAVLSVLAYHLRTELFRGGYVGVDVFFVISGYLISAIILKGIAAGRFSIASFYERRIRRIFPALIFALLGTDVLAYLYFLPTELKDFSKSLLAALFSVSNFYFWWQSGYFSAPIETKPLIHTWSLAVEEQFYIFLPIFLALAHRYFPRKVESRSACQGLWCSTTRPFHGCWRSPSAEMTRRSPTIISSTNISWMMPWQPWPRKKVWTMCRITGRFASHVPARSSTPTTCLCNSTMCI